MSSQTVKPKIPHRKSGSNISTPTRYNCSTPYNCSELLEALKSIQHVVQCSSCHKSLHSARTCLNGHGICWNCKNRCKKTCPVCKGFIMDTKSAMLDEIIKLLPRSCNFLAKGCESLVLATDIDHENFCRFRHTVCRMHGCNWKGMAKDLLLHLEQFHGKEMIRTSFQSSILVSFNAKIDKEGLNVIVAFNNIFWQHIRVRQNRLLQFYQYIPMERPTKKFSVLISMYTPEVSHSSSTPVHTDSVDLNQLFHHKETFCLPKKVVGFFNKVDTGVHYSFKITEANI